MNQYFNITVDVGSISNTYATVVISFTGIETTKRETIFVPCKKGNDGSSYWVNDMYFPSADDAMSYIRLMFLDSFMEHANELDYKLGSSLSPLKKKVNRFLYGRAYID